MTATDYATIDGPQLAKKLETSSPDHDDRRQGFALVNVLPRDRFEREHIPGSINVPHGGEDVLEKRFDKGKEIIVYCASRDCDASPKAARELASRGFQRVVDYEAGLADWKQAGRPVESEAA